MPDNPLLLVGIVVVILMFLVVIGPVLYYLPAMLRVGRKGGNVSIISFIGMDLRKTPKQLILDAHLELINEKGRNVHAYAIELIWQDSKEQIQTSGQLAEMVAGYDSKAIDKILRTGSVNEDDAADDR